MHRSVGNPVSKSEIYAWYVIFVCMIAYLFSFIDRQIVALLVEPIKADLEITDTQFSLLHGLAFALFYAIMGVPIARLADKHSRPLIISIGIVLWSIMTCLCGVARTFWQFFFARMGVGVGEAALTPAVYSMAADLFPREKLGRAIGTYSMGSFMGSGLALIVGGAVIGFVGSTETTNLPLVGNVKPWQLVLFVVGLPGVLVGLLVLFTIRDPRRKGLKIDQQGAVEQVSIRQVFAFISAHGWTITTLFLGFSLYSMAMMAVLSWTPAFYNRVFNVSPAEIGPRLGLVVLIANTTGVFMGGWLVDFLLKKGYTDATYRVGILGASILFVPAVIFPFVEDFTLSLLVVGCVLFFSSFPMPTGAVSLQLLAPNQMRAQVTALFMLCMSFIALAFGPMLVALLTDFVFYDESAVGLSLAIIVTCASVSVVAILAAGMKSYRSSIEQVRESSLSAGN